MQRIKTALRVPMMALQAIVLVAVIIPFAILVAIAAVGLHASERRR